MVLDSCDNVSYKQSLIEKAQKLGEIFGGENKKYIDFIRRNKLEDKEISVLIERYMDSQAE